MSICVCKYPIIVLDGRESSGEVEYLAMPLETMEGTSMPVPDIDYQDVEGLDGITRQYVVVIWKDLTHKNVKKYDIQGHIVVAGCPPIDSVGEDGQLKCDHKEIYQVFHPIEEWIKGHIVEMLPEEKS